MTFSFRTFTKVVAGCIACALASHVMAQQPETLRVMTFNIWVGGESGKQPLEQTAKVIQQARADVIGMQEVCGSKRGGKRPDNGAKIAEQLGMHYLSQGDEDTAFMSRYPIVANTPRKWGAKIELPSGRAVWLFNVHFAASPYQPYQLLKIPYNDTPFFDTADEAVEAARAARQQQVDSMLEELSAVRGEGTPIFVTGDFNEPSEFDWTEPVQKAGRCPVAVTWPTTAAVHREGFADAYRVTHPDPLAAPGYTWTPTTTPDDPADHHDRIDLVLAGGAKAEVKEALVVGENQANADIFVTPYPSDHRAVVVTFTLPQSGP